MREIPRPGERYRHFKNKEYQIITVATHSETGERMVVYQALYGDYSVWVRPLNMFMEKVDREKYPEAKQEYRFERIITKNQDYEDLGMEGRNSYETYGDIHAAEVYSEKEHRSEDFHSEDSYDDKQELHPLVAEFLDSETTEGKLEILQLMTGKVTKRDLDSLCFCLDMNPIGGSTEEELDAIRQCIRMQQKYDAIRLR